ncbi:MAG TPA: Spy/CpxP family protein refolding chaperone [Terriglobia bacterium]|nr:Spy/CpxP family protein refolding chaperone [Terriglobia bacterium]
MAKKAALLLIAMALCSPAVSQSGPVQGSDPAAAPVPSQAGPQMGGMGPRRGPPAGRPMGAWWRNSDVVKQLALTDAQGRQVEQVFQEYRSQLVKLHTVLSQEEARLQPLIAAEHPDDAQVFSQIDKVAEARADVEKVNSRMLFAFRSVLTAEQWQKLGQLGQGMGMGMGMGRGQGMGQGMGMGMGPGPCGPR